MYLRTTSFGVLLSTVVIASAYPTAAKGDTLLAVFDSCCSGGLTPVTDTMDMRLSFDDTESDFNDVGPFLFNTLTLSPADEGRTFMADVTNSPDWLVVTSLLTDGVSQLHSVNVTVQKDNRRTRIRFLTEEAILFADRHPALIGGPDLAGATITAIEFGFPVLDFLPPNAETPSDRIVWLGRTIRFYGVVPEPTSAVALLLLGSLSCLRREWA